MRHPSHRVVLHRCRRGGRQPDNASANASLEPTLPIHIIDLNHTADLATVGKGIGKGNSWPFFL